jgi:CspA family cold shock protein
MACGVCAIIPDEMASGTVKYFNEAKRYGFIARDDGGDDLFVHISNCAENIQMLIKGQRVRFDEQIDKRGKVEVCAVALL